MARYLIDDIEYVSPTEILSLISNKEALMQWAVNISLKANNKFAWREKREQTKDIGHNLHSLIESFINMQIKKTGGLIDFFKQEIFNDVLIKQMFFSFIIGSIKMLKNI